MVFLEKKKIRIRGFRLYTVMTMPLGRAPAQSWLALQLWDETWGVTCLKLTSYTSEGGDTLLGRGERAGTADDRARAGAVGVDRASSDSDTGGGGSRSGSSGGGGGAEGGGEGRAAGSAAGRGSGGRGASVASDGASGALSLLSDGVGLELSLGLVGGGVDGEGHALSAVASLAAVEP